MRDDGGVAARDSSVKGAWLDGRLEGRGSEGRAGRQTSGGSHDGERRRGLPLGRKAEGREELRGVETTGRWLARW